MLSVKRMNLCLECKQQQFSGLFNYRDFRETGPWFLRAVTLIYLVRRLNKDN